MDRWLASLPKTVIAIAAIVIGFVLIVLTDPPKTECDSQLDLFREQQRDFLYYQVGEKGSHQRAQFPEYFDMCQGDSSPGGCFKLFQGLKKMQVDVRNIPSSCSEKAADEAAIKNTLLKSLKLMTRIAWGDHGPTSLIKMQGWFDSSDLAMFCDMKKNASRLIDQEEFDQWRDGVVANLPDANKLEPRQALQRSLFSIACQLYR